MNKAWLTVITTIKNGYTSEYSGPSLTVKILQEGLALNLLLKTHVTGEEGLFCHERALQFRGGKKRGVKKAFISCFL